MQLFDNSGRFCGVPQPPVSSRILLKQPEIDYRSVLESLYSQGFPRANPKNYIAPMGADGFQQRIEVLKEQVRSDPRVSTILNGVHLPLLVPQLPPQYYGSCWDRLLGRSNDYGTLLRKVFMPRVEDAHWRVYPRRRFTNHLDKMLAHQLSIVPESRHDRLVERMSQGHVVGIFFPMALVGFSALQCRHLMASLPENFLLSGGFDLATALVCYPKVLLRNPRKPEMTMAALSWRKSARQLISVKTWSSGVTVSNEADVSYELSSFSAGLFVMEAPKP